MKTIIEILFWPVRAAWDALVFLLKMVLITMMDS